MPEASDAALPDLAFRRVALAGSLGAAVLFVVSGLAIGRYGDRSLDFGWTAVRKGGELVVGHVEAGGRAEGVLHSGDVIVAVDGDHRTWRLTDLEGMGFRGLLPPRSRYELTIRRSGTQRRVRLEAHIEATATKRHISQSLLVAAAVWCVVPLLITLFTPHQKVARHAYAAAMFVGMATLAEARIPALPWASWDSYRALLLVYPLAPLHLAVAYHFFLRFPPDVSVTRGYAIVAGLLYSVCTLIALDGVLLDTGLLLFAPAQLPRVRAALAPVDSWIGVLEGLVYPAAGVAIIALLLRNYRTITSADGRRRMRWLFWATLAGLSPFIVVTLVRNIADLTGAPLQVEAWIVPANLLTTVIPVAVGYSIIKHQLFDIAVVVRRGLQYLLARRALQTLLAIPVLGLVAGAVIHRDRPFVEVLFTHRIYVYLIVAALLSLWYRTRLLGWLDRRFFREAYDRERILLQLMNDVQDLESASGVSKLVSEELEAAFHPECLFIWYREADHDKLTLSYSSGRYLYHPDLGPASPLVRLAERRRSVLRVPLDASAEVPQSERQWLADAGVSLIVPVVASDHDVLGLLMLGTKKSDEPYSPDDITLLQAVARQIAIGRENARLRDKVAHEREIRQNVLSRLETGGFNLLKECPACGACFDAGVLTCGVDGAELTVTLPIERTIDGKYRLERRIGAGGMGVVYESTDLHLARRVAVKILIGRAFGDRVALRRFEREAQTCARLTHPNVVTAYDFGPVGPEGAFLVMELVRGETLRAELRRRGRIPPGLAAVWFEQICAAIIAAHQQGIVHRDLKPENVLITRSPGGTELVKVVDFGLAKLARNAREASSLTEPGLIVGTVAYMAPEQLTGEDADQRSDVFSIGVMAFEALVGRPPFTGRTPSELLLSILHDPLGLDGSQPRLQDVLRRATARKPEDRCQSVAELARDLLPAMAAADSSYSSGASTSS